MNINVFCYIFSQTSKSLTLTTAKTQGNKKRRKYKNEMLFIKFYLVE
jgi:hypothetical protein